VDSLSVAVLSALDKERHEPDCKSGNAVPIERVRLKNEPKNAINRDNYEGGRMRSEHAKRGQRLSDCVRHHKRPPEVR
jgi:hypothetical protein